MPAAPPEPSASGAPGGPDGTVESIIASLDLAPHPEGGWFRRTWTSAQPAPGPAVPGAWDGAGEPPPSSGGRAARRAAASSILYLLAGDEPSAWHRLTDAEEVWIHQAGDPVVLHTSPDGMAERTVLLGPPTLDGAVPVATVGVGHWQSARREAPGAPVAGAGWSLVACVVSPEFRFEHFELAPPCWSPGGDQV